MNKKQFEQYLRRDGGGCIHCGDIETAIPQHRANRGFGGSKLLDRPANIIVLCSTLNSQIESDAEMADYARVNGWKISRQDDPEFMPVWYATEGRWYYLDDFFGREVQLPEK